MKLTVNGKVHDFPEALSVRAILDALGYTEGPVAVERNGEVVPRAQHKQVVLVDGDRLEVVHFVGGG